MDFSGRWVPVPTYVGGASLSGTAGAVGLSQVDFLVWRLTKNLMELFVRRWRGDEVDVYHSEYCSFHCAFHPSGTFGGGGPGGGTKSAIIVSYSFRIEGVVL